MRFHYMAEKVTVEAIVHVPLERVWVYYTDPKHIIHWNNASSDWHTPHAKNDLRVGGRFVFRMEARDGSEGFDFNGTYTEVKKHALISYVIEDGRTVSVTFAAHGNTTSVKTVFEAETINPVKMQREGWQSILNNFKRYVESHEKS